MEFSQLWTEWLKGPLAALGVLIATVWRDGAGRLIGTS